MGSGASSLLRLRKALLIRAYNLRSADETIDDQFRKFSYRNADKQLCIAISDIKRCLNMEPGEYLWIEDIFGHGVTNNGMVGLFIAQNVNIITDDQICRQLKSCTQT